MGSICDCVTARLKIDEEHSSRESMEGMYEPINLKDREIYYERSGEDYYPQILFSYGDETLRLKRRDMVYEFTVRNQFELEAVLPNGDITWFKGTEAPYEGCGELEEGGHYTNNYHECEDILVRVFDKKSNKVITYKVTKEKEEPMTPWEKERCFPETKEPESDSMKSSKPEYEFEECPVMEEVKGLLDEELPF